MADRASKNKTPKASGVGTALKPRPLLGKRFLDAFLFAARAHARQTRKGTEVPYVSHVMGVASLVLEAGGNEDQAIAALLHDVVEDCGGAPMLRQVERRFGPRVARLVEGCTDTDAHPKPPWLGRKQDYIRRLRDEDEDTRLISAADKLYNVRSLLSHYRECGEAVWARFNGKRDGTLWYYNELAKEFSRRPNAFTGELKRVMEELNAMARMSTKSRSRP
jgi:GTP pyrophosphokinase